MAFELCMNCFNVKGNAATCPHCGYVEGTPPEQAFHLTPGTVIANRYIVGVCIGFGGFGITYKAYDTILGVIVAIKEFYPAGLVNRAPGEKQVGVMSGDKMVEYSTQLRRFLMEAQSIAQFGKAKDIVNVYDYFEENGTAYIIMEYIDGFLLKDYMQQEVRLDVDTALHLILAIIEALKKIHGSGIIHRDVSPDNIFITGEGGIKIFDFGAAALAGEQGDTASDAVIKAGYAPPEQYRSKSRQGTFSDIYSVGAILYEMLTGEKPVEASERTGKDTLVPPSGLGVKLDPNLDRAVMQAMAVRPEYRLQYVEQLQEAIEDKRVAEYPEERVRRLRKRRRLAVLITLSSLVACVVVAIVLVNRVRQENEIISAPIESSELSIWVPFEGSQSAEDAKKQMEMLVKDFQSNSGTFQGNDKVSISCEAVPADSYADQFELARQQGTEPDLYCVDFVEDSGGASLEKLYELLNEEEYFGLSDYVALHSEMKSVPFGVRSLCCYSFGTDLPDQQVDISAVLTEGMKKKVCLDERAAGHLVVLRDPSLLKSSPIAVTDNAKLDIEVLCAYANVLSLTDEAKRTRKEPQSVMGLLSGQSEENAQDIQAVIADTDFNKVLYNYNSRNFDRKIEYDRALLTADGAALFEYRDAYAVNGRLTEDENRYLAAQRFLYMCMSGTENSVYYSGTNRVIPIHRGAWRTGENAESYVDELLQTISEGNVTPIFGGHVDLSAYSGAILENSGAQ